MKRAAPKSNALPRRQQGLTLVEIMVAVTLGLILTAGLIQVFVSNKQVYRAQEGLARMQENGRFALDFITRDVRGAGFLGCAGNTTPIVNTLNNPTLLPWNFASPMQGFEWDPVASTWNPLLDASLTSPTNPYPPDSGDVLTVRRSIGDPVPVMSQLAGTPPGSNPITVAAAVCPSPPNPPNPLCDFDAPAPNPPTIAMISDCTNIAVFQITNSNPSSGTINHAPGGTSPGNVSPDLGLGKDFTNTADIVRVSTITYYIRTGTGDPGEPCPLGTPCFWRQDGANPAQPVVEGVENMQIRYGVDTDGDRVPNQYLQANALTGPNPNFNDVVSVRVDLLLQTIEDNLTSSPQRYTYDDGTCGAGCTPADRRYRQVFGATIGLRNKLL